MQCYTTQRNPLIFPDPEAFKPDRWLHENAEMTDAFMPFSKGSRACLGINLAWMELRVVLSFIVGNFHASISKEMKAEDMDMVDYFLLVPKGGKCMLNFNTWQ